MLDFLGILFCDVVAIVGAPVTLQGCTQKGDCLARHMSGRMNKAFIEPKKVEKVLLTKCGLLDKIKEETREEGCDSVRVSLYIDQEAPILKPEQEVFHRTYIKVRQEVMQNDHEESHDGSLIYNSNKCSVHSM
ncbi:hypothetical protein F2Q70_00035403 [Brassica cretica]|uniref:Uncharacterized protein n=1 Tax=Brassica cretica TaxID=69181 RepID=A0A8S9H3G1_BRACR|nr:hypothetical protein F2Q68_00034160 [Brassica cretica]KAF2583632.1 hypothetical protein F2Q70_00035403 [Brassica cretica]